MKSAEDTYEANNLEVRNQLELAQKKITSYKKKIGKRDETIKRLEEEMAIK